MAKKKIHGKDELDLDYSKWSKYVVALIIVIVLFIINYAILAKILGSNNEFINNFRKPEIEDPSLKEPAVAGLFYTSNKALLDKDVSHYIKEEVSSSGLPKMLIVPHAGDKYSSSVVSRVFPILKPHKDTIKKVFIIGPSNYDNVDYLSLPNHQFFQTPLGRVEVDLKVVKKLLNNKGFRSSSIAHREEKSVDFQLPFLQKTLDRRKYKVIPIVYGKVSPEKLAEGLKPYINRKDSIFIFSADLSYYDKYQQSLNSDSDKTDFSENDRIKNLLSFGGIGIDAALILSKEFSMQPKTINLKNSGDIVGKSKDTASKYGSWSFSKAGKNYSEKDIEEEIQSLQDFVDVYRNEIYSIASVALEEAVEEDRVFTPSRSEYSNDLFSKGSVFVTLTKDGELRGSVGNIVPIRAVAQEIANSTYSAAKVDPRFEHIRKEDIKGIHVNISLLTSLEQVRYLDEEDLLKKIEKDSVGLLLIEGDRRGLLLPHVWKEVSDEKDFLRNLKLRSGISPVYWSNKIKIYRFKSVEIDNDY